MKEGTDPILTNFDVDYLLQLGEDASDLCPTFVPGGQECKLPLNVGVYGRGEGHPLVVTVPEIPAPIASLLASGSYYADATIILADGTEMACVYVRAQTREVIKP